VNNLTKLVRSIAAGPAACVLALTFPYHLIIPGFVSLAFAYKIPILAGSFYVGREMFSKGVDFAHLRYKTKMYEKYKEAMDIDKEKL
jgi:hypothetical protein